MEKYNNTNKTETDSASAKKFGGAIDLTKEATSVKQLGGEATPATKTRSAQGAGSAKKLGGEAPQAAEASSAGEAIHAAETVPTYEAGSVKKIEGEAGLSVGEKNSEQIEPFHKTGEHSYHRRAFSHDYFSPFIYHIILKKAKKCEIFGFIKGDARIKPGQEGCAEINESDLGRIIAKAIVHLPYEFRVLKLHQFKVMPDHVHLILQVLHRTDKDLNFYIQFLKESIANKYSNLKKEEIPVEYIFQKGYCDKPLFDDRSLDGWNVYIKLNPHRLAMRLQYPIFFQRIRKLNIDGVEYEAYGNFFLFRNPDKHAVKISRKHSLKQKIDKKALWISEASKGAVLVSPFISPEEKAIRVAAEKSGASIILITHEAFPELFKPPGHDFDLCSAGRLLIISLGLPARTTLTREICERMNTLAEKVVKITS